MSEFLPSLLPLKVSGSGSDGVGEKPVDFVAGNVMHGQQYGAIFADVADAGQHLYVRNGGVVLVVFDFVSRAYCTTACGGKQACLTP